jgi:hypothetical protein
MKADASKGLARRRSTRAKSGPKPKAGASAPSSKHREASSPPSRILQELFDIGTQTFKRLDTETIMRIAEDKDIEHL